jgi:hypothetical protein
MTVPRRSAFSFMTEDFQTPPLITGGAQKEGRASLHGPNHTVLVVKALGVPRN